MLVSILLLAPQSLPARIPLGEVHRAIPIDGEGTTAVVSGDFNGDGSLDLVFAADGPDALRFGEGTGAFLAGDLPALNRDTLALATGDLDGDGALDLFFANDGENELLLGDGAGSFSIASNQLPVASATSRTATVADVDLDGDLDIVVGRTGDRVVQLENDGFGTFRDASERMPVRIAQPRSALLADMDQDGLPEFVAATGGFLSFEENLYYRNSGGGVFVDDSAVLGGGVDESITVFARDIDLDGNLDLLIGVRDTVTFLADDLLLLGDGTGQFTSAPSLLPAFASSGSVRLAEDFDLDGDVDIALTTRYLFLNDGTGDLTTFAPGQLRGSSLVNSLFDLDADGDPDAVIDFLAVDDIALNDGLGNFIEIPGGFEETFPPRPYQGDVTRAVCGDVDGDGDQDIVLAVQIDFQGNSLAMFTNDGNGVFVDASDQIPPVFNDDFAVELLDVEGDGDLDLVHGNAHGNDFFRNDGGGGFEPEAGVLPFNGFVYDFDAADFDDDGDQDLFGSQGIGFLRGNLFYENVSGVLVDDSRRILTNPDDASLESAVFDFDLGGDLDVLVGNWTSGVPDQLLINEGEVFVDGTNLLPAKNDHATNSIAVGDIDNDGDPDVLLGTGFETFGVVASEVAWRNDNGTFVDNSAGLPSTEFCYAIRMGDVDGDGNLDVFVGSYFGAGGEGTDRLLFGDGSGSFALSGWEATTTSTLTSTADAIFEDFDGDRDLDLFLADVFDPRLFQGLRRQVARTAPASIGKRLDIDLYGTASEPWRLLIGSDTIRRNTDLGLLRVDPSSLLTPVVQGQFDGVGKGRFSVDVPANPALIGAEIVLQALEGATPLFTNADVFPIRNL